MLDIKDLHASINGKEILKGINLTVKPEKFTRLWVLTDRGKVHYLRFWQEIGL